MCIFVYFTIAVWLRAWHDWNKFRSKNPTRSVRAMMWLARAHEFKHGGNIPIESRNPETQTAPRTSRHVMCARLRWCTVIPRVLYSTLHIWARRRANWQTARRLVTFSSRAAYMVLYIFCECARKFVGVFGTNTNTQHATSAADSAHIARTECTMMVR